MEQILQSKVKKTLILPISFPQSHLPIIIHVLDSNMRSLPKRLNSTDKQSVCACLLLRNLGECFFSILVEPIARKNASPSDEQLWWFLKKLLSGREIAV